MGALPTAQKGTVLRGFKETAPFKILMIHLRAQRMGMATYLLEVFSE